MVLPGVPRVLHLVVVPIPNYLNVRATARRRTSAQFTYNPNKTRHTCGFYEKDALHRLYDCGTKDFLTIF